VNRFAGGCLVLSATASELPGRPSNPQPSSCLAMSRDERSRTSAAASQTRSDSVSLHPVGRPATTLQFVHGDICGESEIRTRRPAFASRLASNEVASPVAVSPEAEGGRVELPDPKATQVRAELRRRLPSFQSGEQRCRSPERKLVLVFKARWPAAAILSKKRKQEGMIPTARAARWLATRSGPRPVLLP
jgi:hypothetical protein